MEFLCVFEIMRAWFSAKRVSSHEETLDKGFQVDIKSPVAHTRTQTLIHSTNNEGTQTPVLSTNNGGSQTSVTFTERLSDFGEKEVGSTEAFDHLCDICEKQEKEAVGYCKQCEEYYCFMCCEYHGKLKLFRRHCLVGNKDFPGTDNGGKYFDRQLVPASMFSVDTEYTDNYVRCVAFLGPAEHILALDTYTGYNTLKIIEGNGFTKELFSFEDDKRQFHMILSLSGTNNETLLTSPNTQEVLKYTIDTELLVNSGERWLSHSLDMSTEQSETSSDLFLEDEGELDSHTSRFPRYFVANGECWGIAEFDDGFAVSIFIEAGSSQPNWQVQYLDSTGIVKRQIYSDKKDKKNKPLFSRPEYLASNNTQDILYVSDCEKHAVIALDVCGNVLFKYTNRDLFTFTNRELRAPRAMTVDDEDNVYVACGDRVVQIHKSGANHRVLIQKNKDMPDILSVCFNPVSQTLIVGEHSNKVKIYNFQPL